jgi:protocatechuate 3,4-dioxygenase, alpha subunit
VLPTTPSQTAGPFFSIGLVGDPAAGELVDQGAPGALVLTGRVLDGAGEGVPDALVEIWQADGDGVYREDWGWGRSATDERGAYRLVTVKPGRVPTDGGGPLQAPHLSMFVFARGLLKPVFTRMYFPDERSANDADPVLAALAGAERAALVATSEDGGLSFDIRLQGERQTPFFAV